MPELIFIVIIATFIAGLSFCDREEKESAREFNMYRLGSPATLFWLTREGEEEFWNGDQWPGGVMRKSHLDAQLNVNRIMSDRLTGIKDGPH